MGFMKCGTKTQKFYIKHIELCHFLGDCSRRKFVHMQVVCEQRGEDVEVCDVERLL